jgi:hypothetical protein
LGVHRIRSESEGMPRSSPTGATNGRRRWERREKNGFETGTGSTDLGWVLRKRWKDGDWLRKRVANDEHGDSRGIPDLNGRWDLVPYALGRNHRASNDGVSPSRTKWDSGVARINERHPGTNDPVIVVVTPLVEAARG